MDYRVSRLQVTLWNSSLIKAPRWSSAEFLIMLSAVLSSPEGMCVQCCFRRSIKPAAGEPCLSIEPLASSLERTMLENSNLLWSCKEKEKGAFQFLRAVRKEKSVSSTKKPRTGSTSVLNVGIFVAGCQRPLFIDCGSAFMSCFNITSAREVTKLTLTPLCTYNLKYPRGNWSSEPLHAS